MYQHGTGYHPTQGVIPPFLTEYLQTQSARKPLESTQSLDKEEYGLSEAEI